MSVDVSACTLHLQRYRSGTYPPSMGLLPQQGFSQQYGEDKREGCECSTLLAKCLQESENPNLAALPLSRRLLHVWSFKSPSAAFLHTCRRALVSSTSCITSCMCYHLSVLHLIFPTYTVLHRHLDRGLSKLSATALNSIPS